MAADSLRPLRQHMVDAAQLLMRSGALSLSHGGNVSVRVPGSDQMLHTGSGSLDNLRPDQLPLLDFEGRVLKGEIAPANAAEIIQMHTLVYKHRPEAGAVVHTHSPFATSFAVAGRAMDCWYEAMVRWGMTDGVPLAHYGPHGSRMALANIAAALVSREHIRAVLLENHGILAFGPDPMGAARTVLVLEEAARLALYAEGLGGARIIPPELRRITLEQQDEFAQAGI